MMPAPLLRHAMNYAVANFGAVPILRNWRNGIPERQIIAGMVARERRDTARTYGRSHPEAAGRA